MGKRTQLLRQLDEMKIARLTAEVERLREMLNERTLQHRVQMDNAARLTKEVEQLTAERDVAVGDNAGMLLFLQEIEVLVHPVYDDFTFCPSCGEQAELVGMAVHRGDCKLHVIISEPHPGQVLLERQARLEAVIPYADHIGECQVFRDHPCDCGFLEALAAIDQP